jgi:hypothetical protein
MGIVSLGSVYIVDHPYSFFPQSGYTLGHEILLVILIHITTILTLLFGLLIKPKQTSLSQQSAFYAPPPPTAAG